MKKILNILLIVVFISTMASCDDFFEPNFTNDFTKEQVYDYKVNPTYVERLYIPAYNAIPLSYTSMGIGGDFLDCATDNAVSNNTNSTCWKMNTIPGYITASNYPLSPWKGTYNQIRSVNEFLEVGLNNDIEYIINDSLKNAQLKSRIKGEAYFLRAYSYANLLKVYAGQTQVNGVMMGVPIVKKVIDESAKNEIIRSKYSECIDFIISDIDTALSTGGLLENYTDAEALSKNMPIDLFGDAADGLPTSLACYALKSRVLLYAASPTYSYGLSKEEINKLYLKSAEASKKIIDYLGGLEKVYDNFEEDFFLKPLDNKELILRRIRTNDNSEEVNFPPCKGIQGQGRTNPSQNLVNSFPMSNGYPIDNSNSGYDESHPYANRDPRLEMTVIHNGEVFKGVEIQVYPGGNCSVGYDDYVKDDSHISKTGYYLRKFMSSKRSYVSDVQDVKRDKYCAAFRAVEAYLNYAEAMNHVYGPTGLGAGNLNMSAKEALRVVRNRAGIPSGGDQSVSSDAYLASLNNTEDLFKLIKNERRIELCFEGHRFYDLRRWGDTLGVTLKKINVSKANIFSDPSYKEENLYTPAFKTLYGAIPQSEINICPNLKQNIGWN